MTYLPVDRELSASGDEMVAKDLIDDLLAKDSENFGWVSLTWSLFGSCHLTGGRCSKYRYTIPDRMNNGQKLKGYTGVWPTTMGHLTRSGSSRRRSPVIMIDSLTARSDDGRGKRGEIY